MIRTRRKGVAIVESKKGILVVSGRSKIFALPGGGAKRGESRRRATKRELREETGLRTKSTKYLFSYVGRKWKDSRKRIVINYAKVFSIKAFGRLRPRSEIRHVGWYKAGSSLRISKSTKKLIEKYFMNK